MIKKLQKFKKTQINLKIDFLPKSDDNRRKTQKQSIVDQKRKKKDKKIEKRKNKKKIDILTFSSKKSLKSMVFSYKSHANAK